MLFVIKGDVDVCIGSNEDWSKPGKELLEYTVNLFEDNGYSVGYRTISPSFITRQPSKRKPTRGRVFTLTNTAAKETKPLRRHTVTFFKGNNHTCFPNS